ncbi:hypothetical protein Tsubulata_018327, partial [Turnera subulata]
WKETGETRQIKARNKVIGTQKKLVFHYKVAGSRLGTRTHWVIHEYRRIETINDPTALVICKLKYKSNAAAVADQGEPCFSMAFDVENHTSQPTTSGVDAGELQFPIPGDTADFNVPSSFHTLQNFLLSSDDDKEDDLITSNQIQMSHYFASDFGNTSSNGLVHNSAYAESQVSCSRNENPTMLVARSTNESCLLASDLENQKSTLEFLGEWIPSMNTPPDSKNQSPCDKSDHSISQTQNNISDISASGIGQCGTSMALSTDFEKQNPLMSYDIPILHDTPLDTSLTYPSNTLLTYPSESMVPQGEAMFPESNKSKTNHEAS